MDGLEGLIATEAMVNRQMEVLKDGGDHFPDGPPEDQVEAHPDGWKPAPKVLDFNVPEYHGVE